MSHSFSGPSTLAFYSAGSTSTSLALVVFTSFHILSSVFCHFDIAGAGGYFSYPVCCYFVRHGRRWWLFACSFCSTTCRRWRLPHIWNCYYRDDMTGVGGLLIFRLYYYLQTFHDLLSIHCLLELQNGRRQKSFFHFWRVISHWRHGGVFIFRTSIKSEVLWAFVLERRVLVMVLCMIARRTYSCTQRYLAS